MSTRSQVWIEEEGVYLYQHYDGYNLPNVVKSALSKGQRWDDSEYLARIIFCEMVKSDIGGSTGYGIGSTRHSDIEYLVTITKDMKVIVEKGYDTQMNILWSGSFEEFVLDARGEW